MIDTKYLDAIKRFEGFTPRAQWDYAQSSNGYGTRARFEGEVIDRAEADRRFKAEIKAAYDVVERFAPSLDEGTKAALTSLTYNAGPSWTSSGLGNAVSTGDMATAKAIFQQYTKAGGQSLAGLEQRRTAEAAWFQDLNSEGGQINQVLAATTPISVPSHTARMPEIAFLQNFTGNQTVSPTTSGSARAVTDPIPLSDFDPAAKDMKSAAALTLANILSILSLSHIEEPDANGAKERSESERRLAGMATGNSTASA